MVETSRGKAYWSFVGHLSDILERVWDISLFLVLFYILAMSSCNPAMVCCFATGPKKLNHPILDWKFQNDEQKYIISLYKLFPYSNETLTDIAISLLVRICRSTNQEMETEIVPFTISLDNLREIASASLFCDFVLFWYRGLNSKGKSFSARR